MMGTLKAVLFRFSAVLISFLFVALLGEGALRLIAPGGVKTISERSRICRFDHDLGWAPLENITQAETGKLVHQNQFGLRGPDDMQPNKTTAKKRVLVLGDSYVWGFGVDQAKLFSAPEIHGSDEEILNFGVS